MRGDLIVSIIHYFFEKQIQSKYRKKKKKPHKNKKNYIN